MYLENKEDNNEILIVKRKTGKSRAVISLDEYNFIKKQFIVLSSKTNADRLYESVSQMKTRLKILEDLIDDSFF